MFFHILYREKVFLLYVLPCLFMAELEKKALLHNSQWKLVFLVWLKRWISKSTFLLKAFLHISHIYSTWSLKDWRFSFKEKLPCNISLVKLLPFACFIRWSVKRVIRKKIHHILYHLNENPSSFCLFTESKGRTVQPQNLEI